MNKPLLKAACAASRYGVLAWLGMGMAFAQQAPSTSTTTTNKDEPQKMEKFVVTGSYIPQPSGEPIAPVAILTDTQIRALGATSPTQALRTLPSFVSSAGTNGATELDSNGGNGSAYVSLRGLGSDYTLTLIDGRPAGDFANLNLLPVDAVARIETLRDGAGVIYGPSAIGGAVNVILKKNFTGTAVDVMGGAATRSPGSRETYQASFISGVANNGTSVVATGSVFKNRTIYASQRPNTANPDARAKGGINGGSPTFAGVIADASGNPFILKPGFSSSATPTAADYIVMDQNAFSSNQLFNFRQYSPSAPGQERQSLYASIEQEVVGKSLVIFGDIMHSRLSTANGLAPAPFALDADPAGPSVGSLTDYGPYAPPGQTLQFFRYRSVELGNRTENQTFDDNRYSVGARGDIFQK